MYLLCLFLDFQICPPKSIVSPQKKYILLKSCQVTLLAKHFNFSTTNLKVLLMAGFVLIPATPQGLSFSLALVRKSWCEADNRNSSCPVELLKIYPKSVFPSYDLF